MALSCRLLGSRGFGRSWVMIAKSADVSYRCSIDLPGAAAGAGVAVSVGAGVSVVVAGASGAAFVSSVGAGAAGAGSGAEGSEVVAVHSRQ